MFSKGNVLSLGVSLCSVVLVYLYMKNRLNNVENKVDRLIEIIQLYDQQTQLNQMGGNSERIVVSDAENDDEESDGDSSEEDEYEEEAGEGEDAGQSLQLEEVDHGEGLLKASLVLQTYDFDINNIKHEIESQMLKLSSNETVNTTSPDIEVVNDGLDDMDDLDEDADDLEKEDLAGESTVDLSKLGKVELKKLCEEKGMDTKGKKKQELIELLK
jgi:hypothetical protein